MTIWSVFNKDTGYFEPSNAPFMVNYRVEDMDALLDALKAEGGSNLNGKTPITDVLPVSRTLRATRLSYGSRRRANSLRHCERPRKHGRVLKAAPPEKLLL